MSDSGGVWWDVLIAGSGSRFGSGSEWVGDIIEGKSVGKGRSISGPGLGSESEGGEGIMEG